MWLCQNDFWEAYVRGSCDFPKKEIVGTYKWLFRVMWPTRKGNFDGIGGWPLDPHWNRISENRNYDGLYKQVWDPQWDKITKKGNFDGSYGTHKGTEFPKRENLMDPQLRWDCHKRELLVMWLSKKGIFLMKISLFWRSKIAFLGNFFFWKVFPTEISKKRNFDGRHKWPKIHFGLEFPFLEGSSHAHFQKKRNFDGLHKHFKNAFVTWISFLVILMA